jgi:hypothetical protein
MNLTAKSEQIYAKNTKFLLKFIVHFAIKKEENQFLFLFFKTNLFY